MDLARRQVVLTLTAFAGVSRIANGQGRQTPAPPPQAPPADPEATATELRNALNGLVRYEIVRRGAKLAEEAAKAVEAIVVNGVEQMRKRDELLNAYAVSIAVDGARRLGAEIVAEANRVREDLTKISAKVVQAARTRLCPLYPFC